MNQQDLATCHCIISHPSKPKFLVIKHSDSWSPPVLKFPEMGSIVPKTRMINDGMKNKYGLQTTLLRRLARLDKYHCIEVEMRSKRPSKKLKAVWVGSKEYQQFRSSKPGEYDPIEIWLKQKESGKIPVQRPPWERTGWFKKADYWIHQQLDRLNIQVTGSVQQLRSFRTASCILQVSTSYGKIFFKASYARPPHEAALTQALARNWPGLVPEPLAIDSKRNWMLMRDYHSPEHSQIKFEDYPSIARSLAKIQLDSLDSMDAWKELGCPVQGLDDLASFLQQLDRLAPVLGDEGGTALRGTALNDEEIDQLRRAGGALQTACRELADYPIPHTLVHPDIWYPNLTAKNGAFQITDWMGTVISHPFFSILKLLRFRELWGSAQPPLPADQEYDVKLRKTIREAYLEPFTRFESKDHLQAAMALTDKLQPAWRLFKWSQEIDDNEPESLSYYDFAHFLQRRAREVMGGEAG
jgi:hypothetical protein